MAQRSIEQPGGFDLGLSENWGYLILGGPYKKDPTI